MCLGRIRPSQLALCVWFISLSTFCQNLEARDIVLKFIPLVSFESAGRLIELPTVRVALRTVDPNDPYLPDETLAQVEQDISPYLPDQAFFTRVQQGELEIGVFGGTSATPKARFLNALEVEFLRCLERGLSEELAAAIRTRILIGLDEYSTEELHTLGEELANAWSRHRCETLNEPVRPIPELQRSIIRNHLEQYLTGRSMPPLSPKKQLHLAVLLNPVMQSVDGIWVRVAARDLKDRLSEYFDAYAQPGTGLPDLSELEFASFLDVLIYLRTETKTDINWLKKLTRSCNRSLDDIFSPIRDTSCLVLKDDYFVLSLGEQRIYY